MKLFGYEFCSRIFYASHLKSFLSKHRLCYILEYNKQYLILFHIASLVLHISSYYVSGKTYHRIMIDYMDLAKLWEMMYVFSVAGKKGSKFLISS